MSIIAAVGNSTQTLKSSTFTIEELASDTIRRINEAVREREGRLREPIVYDRDFKRISEEVGGADILGNREPLEDPMNEDGFYRTPLHHGKVEVDFLDNTSLPWEVGSCTPGVLPVQGEWRLSLKRVSRLGIDGRLFRINSVVCRSCG